jgi:heme oxygenase
MPLTAVSPDGRSVLGARNGDVGSLRECLRTETSEAHARLDGQLSALDLRDVEGYRLFLEINAAGLLPLEIALEESGVGRHFPDWPLRSRTRAILDDLSCLGCRASVPELLPALSTDAIFGTMYVLEGSRLGARMLARRVAQAPHILALGGTRFLNHGNGLPLWQGFLSRLERHAAAGADTAAVVRAARDAFTLFEQAAASRCGPAAARQAENASP